MEKYKGHIITTKWHVTKDGTPMGYIWILDGTTAFRSRKDAKAYVNGERPRWGFAPVSSLK